MIFAPLLAAAAATAQAVIPVEVQLDARGKVTDCRMLEEPVEAGLAQRICMALLEHAQFEPGRDEAGNPVPSKTITTVRVTARPATAEDLARATAPAASPSAPASAR